MLRNSLRPNFLFLTAITLTIFITGCSVEASKISSEAAKPASIEPFAKGPTIKIEPNGPADTVRAFYKNLRENRIREAIFLTNLRPAIEGLTDTELKEFQVDFEAVARQIPADVEINGEIISGNDATVTAKLPDENAEDLQIQEVRLRKENGTWVILTVDEEAEKLIRKEGKNYFYALKIETHQDEARTMLDRISKAQIAYSLQNNNTYAEIPALIEKGFLPADIQTSRTTGYNYTLTVSKDKQTYSVTATPEIYGKTGKLTFTVELDDKRRARLTSKDLGGRASGK